MTGATPRSWAIQLLGLVAGYADAAAYLSLGHVFAANMTGNTVLLGIGLVEGVGGTRLLPHGPVRPLAALAAFALGTLLAALVLRAIRWRNGYRLVLLLEAALFVAAAAGATAGGTRPGFDTQLTLLAVLSGAMGVQSALANRVGVPGVPTTVVTSSMVTALVRAVDRGGRAGAGAPAIAWAVYLAGGVAGAVGIELLGSAAFWPPPVVLAVLAGTAAERD